LCNDPAGGRKPITAKCETVRNLPTFRDAYRKRRCIVPVDGFFEWKAIKGQKAKQPYAIAMKDGTPFGLVLSRFVLELGDAISGISRVPSQAARSIG
jgi:putative SOS response-associated peptidase YedK